MKKLPAAVILSCLLLSACAQTPANVGSANVRPAVISGYLEELGLNTPGVSDNVTYALRNGGKFREKIKDQTGKSTMLTAWIEGKANQTLCMTYYRDEKCPDCNGTGQRKAPDFIGSKAGIAFTCRRCKGEGKLLNQFHRRCWMFSAEEFSDREGARAHRDSEVLRHAPSGTEEQISRLASDDPRERLEACVWLNSHYIKQGQDFQELTPMLDRAHYVGAMADEHKFAHKIIGKRLGNNGETVYQFIAGRGLPEENGRAYFRVIVDNASGKVVKTMFVADAPRRR